MNKNDKIFLIILLISLVGLLFFAIERERVDIRQTFIECFEKTNDAAWCYDKI